DTTGQPDGHGRPDSHVQRDSDRYRSVELSVEEERHRYFWSDLLELYHAGHDEFRQRGTVYGSGQQHRRERDQRRGQSHSECGSGGPFDHDTTGQPDGHGRPDSLLQRRRDRYRSVELSVGEERYGHFWSDLLELYHAGHDEFRQRGTVYGSGQQ